MSMRDQIAKAIAGRIKAWHASPHDFDRVDLSKVGTGQGAQSYGHGFYAAESPKVSGVGGEYWQEFARNFTRGGDVTGDAVELLQTVGGDRAAALANIENQIKNQRPGPYSERVGTRLREVRDLLASDKQVGPRVYELDIKADPKSFLQWDKTLAEQPNITQKLPMLLDAAKDEAYWRAVSATSKSRQNELYDMVKNPEQATGEFAYRGLAERFKGHEYGEKGPSRVARTFDLAGVPGVRYLDEKSRALGADDADRIAAITKEIAELRAGGFNLRASELDQTRAALQRTADIPRTYNYVVNTPDIIDITKKYGIPGALGAAAAPELLGNVAAQDQYQ